MSSRRPLQLNNFDDARIAKQQLMTECCIPLGKCLNGETVISFNNLSNTIRVICSNSRCTAGFLMHKNCFDFWEGAILYEMKKIYKTNDSLNSLWTGIKMSQGATNHCKCKCGKGILTKDLDWDSDFGEKIDCVKSKRRRKSYSKVKIPNSTQESRFSESSNEMPTASTSSSINDVVMESPTRSKFIDLFFQPSTKNRFTTIPNSDGSGFFTKRTDYSQFNNIHFSRINSFHIKIDDDGPPTGNDSERSMVLSTLFNKMKNTVRCVVCHQSMIVYHAYPLLDGAFFLSPRQHLPDCVEMAYNNQMKYLTAVCIHCLHRTYKGRKICCVFCRTSWNGSKVMLGALTTYDLFAAQPCCIERCKCFNCNMVLLKEHQFLHSFSEYSQSVSCPNCQMEGYSFVPDLNTCYVSEMSTDNNQFAAESLFRGFLKKKNGVSDDNCYTTMVCNNLSQSFTTLTM